MDVNERRCTGCTVYLGHLDVMFKGKYMKTQFNASLITALFLVTACDNSSTESESDSETKIETVEVTKKQADKTEQERIEHIKKSTGKTKSAKSLEINGEKFTSFTTVLVKGSKVYNVQMREPGTVKGSIVVVSTMDVKTLSADLELTSAVKIAKDTYRLLPKQQTNLHEYYHALRKTEGVEVTELEIDYSGKSPETK